MTIPVSVVTVTYNNAGGLRRTLVSLAALQFKPLEVVIVDGGSTDDTSAVVAEFHGMLPLSFKSETDAGIYDAMNKGLCRSRGTLVHYLNGGDTVYGEPYRNPTGPARLTVRLTDESGRLLFHDFVKHGGYGYCHQGIIFPAKHPHYRTQFKICADLDAIIATFPEGVSKLPLVDSGGVIYALGGVSSRTLTISTREALQIFRERLPWHRSVRLQALLVIKNLFPRPVRRFVLSIAKRYAIRSPTSEPR